MTNEVIVFADIEALVISALRTAFTARSLTVHVADRVPDDTSRYITVALVDSERIDLVIDRSTVRVSAYDTTKEAATDLGQLARGILGSLQGAVVGTTTVYRVTDAQVQDAPDELTNLPGFTFHTSLSTRGVAG